MSLSRKIIVSIAAAFAFTVLLGEQPAKICSFFPSQAIFLEDEQADTVGEVSLIDADGKIEFRLRIVEVLEEIKG